MKKIKPGAGAWSATPTPFTESLKIDTASVRRMIRHHIRLGQQGVFIGGTCGEGPWLPRQDMRKLTQVSADAAGGKIKIAVQVTDNSFTKVLEHIKDAKTDGADIAIVAEPWFSGPMSRVLEKHYMEIVEHSVLPVGIYSRSATLIPHEILKKALMHDNVILFKDSSISEDIRNMALAVARRKPSLLLLTGYEQGMTPYLEAGYDGILAGGGILIGKLTAEMVKKAQAGDFAAVARLHKKCDKINYTVYGGKKITSWLKGLKYALVKMGIFSTTNGYLQFPMTPEVRKSIDKLMDDERKVLFS
jgi:4-hydroxy-tetrahydrodipicolinate synthase